VQHVNIIIRIIDDIYSILRLANNTDILHTLVAPGSNNTL